MKPGIFASGLGKDGSYDIRWVATRGDIHDWAIYYGRPEQSEESIRHTGDKFFSADKIRNLVECDDEAFKMYRY